MKDRILQFKRLSPSEILAQPPGKWGDSELLDVANSLEQEGDRERGIAVIKLILHSPENATDLVVYDDLYVEVMEHERRSGNRAEALRWAYAALAYAEQHSPGEDRANRYRDIGETYLQTGDVDTGLAIFARLLEADPTDVWTHNVLALNLPHIDLPDLAVEVLDWGLKLVGKHDPEGLKRQFTELRRETAAQSAQGPGRLEEVDAAVLASFRAALQRSKPHPEGIDAYLPPVDQLVAPDGRDMDAVYADVLRRGKALAADLIRMAFDGSLQDTPAPGHAVSLLRTLLARDLVELGELAHWLRWAEGDWHRELLTEKMGKIGGHTTDELKDWAGNAGHDLFVRSNASAALVERAQKCPEQREEIVRFMRLLLTRPEAHELAAEETFLGFLIGDIMDWGAVELYPEIEAAFQEDRVDPMIIDLAFVQQEWGLPVTAPSERCSDGLYVSLKCKNCGRVRTHFVQHVTVDLGTQRKQTAGEPVRYDPHVMDREIVCPKCGSRDRYQVEPVSAIALMLPIGGPEDLVDEFIDDQGKIRFRPNPRVSRFESYVFGRPLHPLEGLDQYRRLIAVNPRDVDLYLRVGGLLRVLHRYPDSLDAFQKAYDLEPENPECLVLRAMAEHDYGDRELARQLYQKVLHLARERPGWAPNMADLSYTARMGLRALDQGEDSSWEPDVISRSDRSSPQGAARSQRQRAERPRKRMRGGKKKRKRRK